MVYDVDMIKLVLQPILWCKTHFKNKRFHRAFLYFWTKKEHKIYLNKGDKIINKVKIWTTHSSESKEDLTASQLRQRITNRYHMTNKCLTLIWNMKLIECLVFFYLLSSFFIFF